MAGAGYKLFNTGDVLTAAQVNTYLMQQTVMVFASATARTTALSGVLAEGMVSYLQDTNATEVYDGSAWVAIANTGDITSVGVTSPITGGGTSGAVTIAIQDASTTQKGAVQLTDSISSTSTTTAATPNSVKSAYDLANGAIAKTLTSTTGDIIYASSANTPARLGIGSSGQVLTVASGIPSWATASGGTVTFSGCRAFPNSNVSCSSGAYTEITMGAESFDTDSYHSTSSNTGRLTIPTGKTGYYQLISSMTLAYSASGRRITKWEKNGSTTIGLFESPRETTAQVSLQASGIYYFSAGDYIKCYIYQDSGGSLNVTGNADGDQSFFSIAYLGA